MKIIKKEAKLIVVIRYGGEEIPDYRCPTCGEGVIEEYVACPYCAQRLKFPKNVDYSEFKFKSTEYDEKTIQIIKDKILGDK